MWFSHDNDPLSLTFSTQYRGFAHEEGEEKTFFQDSPWNPTFDVHYLNGGGALVDIGLDVSTDDMSSAA